MEEQELQFGPVWHVDTVLAQGPDWLQSLQAPFTGGERGHDQVWQSPARHLLIKVMADQPASPISTMANPLQQSGHRQTIYGCWKGLAQPNQTYAFDSFLLPNDITSAPEAADLAKRLKVIASTTEWTLAQLDENYVVINPLGRSVEAGGIRTDFHFLHLNVSDGHVNRAEGVQGTDAKFQQASLFHAGKPSDFTTEQK